MEITTDYKKAIEQMILDGIISQEEAVKYCPDLVESEDEKIRKDIIYHIKNCDDTIDEDTEKRMLAWLEKQGEQKPADKVEPKFHKGEWLCENEPDNYARFIQILEIVNVQGKDRYRISRDIHKDEDIVEFDFVEKYYHKFDIKDAKDGDVLVSKSGNKIFSYRGNLDLRGRPCAHYGIYKVYDGIRFSPCAIGNYFTSEEVFPATKEQRDLLFQKMHEAGYEWDAEKKELKEIEQNAIEPDELIEESYQQQADDLIDMVTEKPAWDEEDERHFELIITICEEGQEIYQTDSLPYINIGEAIEWLESIKARYTWKPSDEQIRILYRYAEQNNYDGSVLTSLYQDLKKLK